MLDEKNNRPVEQDPMKEPFGELKKQVLPPPALEKAVMAGVPYGRRERARVHVLRIIKAAAAYVVGIALFLGMIVMLPHLGEEGNPVGTDSHAPTTTVPVTPTFTAESTPPVSAVTTPSFTTDSTPPKTEPVLPPTQPQSDVLPSLLPVSSGLDLSLDGKLTASADRETVRAAANRFLSAYDDARSTLDPDSLDDALGTWKDRLNQSYYNLLIQRSTLLKNAGCTQVKSSFEIHSVMTQYSDGALWISAIETVNYQTANGVETESIYHDFSMRFAEKDSGGFSLEIASIQDSYIEPWIGLDSELSVNVYVNASAVDTLKIALSPYRITAYRPMSKNNFVLRYELDYLDAYDFNITCPLPSGSQGESVCWITSDGKYAKVEWVDMSQKSDDPPPATPQDPMTVPMNYNSVGSPKPGTMSAEVEAEIKRAYAVQHGKTPEDVKVKFVANINGKYAVELEAGLSHWDEVTIETVYGLDFVSNDSNTMLIYYKGKFYTIPNAYAQGVLSAREVQELYAVSHHYGVASEIREKCALRYGGVPDDYFVRFVENGSWDGVNTWFVVYLYGSIPVQNKVVSETVDGRTFYYSDTRMMEVYYQGEFYTLAKAFEKGIMGEWDIRWLHYDHIERQSQEPLNEKTKMKIAQDWKKQFGSELTWQSEDFRYYGNYNGCVVLFKQETGKIPRILYLPGFRFVHSTEFELYVYANGEFVDLITAYRSGWVDFDALNFIMGAHNQ